MEYVILKNNKTASKIEANSLHDLHTKLVQKGLIWDQGPNGIVEIHNSSSITHQIEGIHAIREYIVPYNSVNYGKAGLVQIAARDENAAMTKFNVCFIAELGASASGCILPREVYEVR